MNVVVANRLFVDLVYVRQHRATAWWSSGQPEADVFRVVDNLIDDRRRLPRYRMERATSVFLYCICICIVVLGPKLAKPRSLSVRDANMFSKRILNLLFRRWSRGTGTDRFRLGTFLYHN